VTITDTARNLSALAGVVVLAFGAANYFQTKAEAAEQKQQTERTVQQLRAEVLLVRVKQLNAKADLTPDEKLELELLIAQVRQIQAEGVKK